MEIFNAIGLKIPKGKTLSDLAEDAERKGEASLSTRPSCVIHGRCWRIGFGLEVWTILYESETGEVFFADCRPGFRARYTQNLSDWSLFETEAEGEAAIEGYTENYGVKVFFQLQNLTEAAAGNFEQKKLTVGLCGLAYHAEVSAREEKSYWKSSKTNASKTDKTNWHLCGKVIEFNALRNPFSGSDLYWIHLDLGNFELEILVNRHALTGSDLCVGATIKAKIWLQGHIASRSTFYSNYEGVDWSVNPVDFWKQFKKQN